LQIDEPDQNSKPLYAIEETKTDDSESRNTGVYQRSSKFVYVEFYYPGVKKNNALQSPNSAKEKINRYKYFRNANVKNNWR